MAAHESISDDQFEDLVFPGVPGYKRQWTKRGKVPVVPEGHNRIWRATNIGMAGQSGHWSKKPLPAYGGDMLYQDIPHDKMPAPMVSGMEAKGQSFLLGRDHATGQRVPMPGSVNMVQFHSEKDYELSDWDEYRKRWSD